MTLSKDGFDALEQLEAALDGCCAEHELHILRRCLNKLKVIEGYGPTIDLTKNKVSLDLDKTVYDGLMWRGITIGYNQCLKQVQNTFNGQTVTFKREN